MSFAKKTSEIVESVTRMQEPERWDYWHKQWRSDPQMIEDMYDAHLMKEWESKFKK